MKFPHLITLLLFSVSFLSFFSSQSRAATAAELEQRAISALSELYSNDPDAHAIGDKAKAILVIFFNQKGLMGGLGVQGTKITRYTPSA